MKRPLMYFALGIALIQFNSCQKNEIAKLEEDASINLQQTAVETSLTETQVDEALSDVDLLVDEAITINASLLRSATIDSSIYVNECPVITVNTEVKPNVMTIDFGTACTGKDGKIRSGKIIVTAASFKLFPSERSKSFDNYYVDGKKIEGSVSKVILRDSINHNRTATIKENVIIIIPEKKDTAFRVSTMTRVYQNNVLKDKTDDQIVSWGTVVNTRPNGVVVTKTIAEATPLVYKVSCKHIVSGIASFVNSKGRTWSIDYGDGTCDNVAIFTENGVTKEITIR